MNVLELFRVKFHSYRTLSLRLLILRTDIIRASSEYNKYLFNFVNGQRINIYDSRSMIFELQNLSPLLSHFFFRTLHKYM